MCRAAGNLSVQETDSAVVEALFKIAVDAIRSHIDDPDVVEPATWMFTNYYGATFAGRDPATGIDIISQVLARYPTHLKVNCKCCHALNNIVGERKQWAAMMVEKNILHMILDRLVQFAAVEFTTPAMDLLVPLSGVPDGAQYIAAHLDRVFAVTIPLIQLEPFDFAMASAYKPTVSHRVFPQINLIAWRQRFQQYFTACMVVNSVWRLKLPTPATYLGLPLASSEGHTVPPALYWLSQRSLPSLFELAVRKSHSLVRL